ncbi:MAG: aminotransferase class V-fold PLP-dependent enzyme [Casimicrobiaceae bacterium]
MTAPAATSERIDAAIRAVGPGELTASVVERHIAPLFARHKLAYGERVYLANHSLGRPLDATEDDVREGLAHWYAEQGGAWEAWAAEIAAHRARLAALLGVPRADSIVPKTSAGQGLRAVLNALDATPRVVATRGEFDSLDVILREYARRRHIDLAMVEPREGGRFDTNDIIGAIGTRADLVVVSEVMFNTGQRIADLPAIVAATHAAGGKLLVDVYHAMGVFESDLAALDADFAVGGSYKYLRGGPGACFLYVHPRHLDAGLRTLDTGWFAKEAPFAYERPDPPRFAPGGDGWMESTPAFLPFYQARAGQLFALAIGVARLRSYSLAAQRRLVASLGERGVRARGGSEDRGAFVVVETPRAVDIAEALKREGIVTDARGPWLRLCPDILTTDDELDRAAVAVGALFSG